MSLFPRNILVLATRNEGKVKEMQLYLEGRGVEIVTASSLGLPDVPETGTTFEDNAMLKAVGYGEAAGLAVMADDSGLEASALGGAPGVYTADWAGPERNFRMAMSRLQREVEAAGEDRRANFVSVVILRWPDGRILRARGEVCGRLIFPGRGTGGFGYNPVFMPDGDTKTFAEMTATERARYSHRRRAMDKVLAELDR
ncbi:MAG: non-canonical purine NTP pyrophosphatase [Parvularculaceae bacterium]|nr:non-canonical purine NTP pyrophosphatase [Parvularculaceae bacterium]